MAHGAGSLQGEIMSAAIVSGPVPAPQPERSAAVSCRGVTKAYGEGDTCVWALRGIDLELPVGELALLVGPSGCGKTTLISLIAGLLEPTAGEVSVFDTRLTTLSDKRKVL